MTPVVAWTGSMAQVVSEGSWERRCRDAPSGLAWWSHLSCCRLGVSNINDFKLTSSSVGNTSVGGGLILIKPKKCISYHF